ncbi:MAG: hypothetical protein QN152_03125 [Armatimonadota bacterium]|nr:hypothetical protein [Armatimonadota bacterium]MDR7463209.1 hypothetical protein [Armatimonadota bacterium]MDR7469411.1 hypothetical protein [Armatimonadota bacterium]MDR7474753.1 hypothetical protein [Armatimonadota bacterium]MDR7538509.1 hypothetical protein [Armatimonadota bacterium]
MTHPGMCRAATILFLVIMLLMLPSSGAAQQITYHRVAPKIYVPFNPNTVKVLHQSARLFTVEVPASGYGYAFYPKISPFGDAIVFVPGDSTFAFTSVFLERVKLLRIPGDVASPPAEVRRFAAEGPDSFSFDRLMRTVAFSCEIQVTDPKLPEKEVCIMRSDGTGLRRLTRPLRRDEDRYKHAAAPAISEDGSFVVYRRQYAGYLGAVRSDGTGLRVLVHRADGLTPVVLARRAAFYLRGGQVWRAGPDGGGPRQLSRERGEIRALAADREGTRVAYVGREIGQPSVLKVVDGASGAPLLVLKGVEHAPLRLSGDGRRVLFSRRGPDRRGLYVVDLRTREVLEVSQGMRAGEQADFNETGEVVVMVREDGPPLALAFLPDETPPFLAADGPREGSTVRGESVGVAVTYRDRAVVSGVDPRALRVFLNGRDVSDRLQKGPDRATGQLDRRLLREGENVLEARVTDRAGNEARQVIRFRFEAAR